RQNFRPKVWPRRHTTSQVWPLRPSRENDSFSLLFTELGSSVRIFAPLSERSSTVQGRAAKPPSSTIQPDCCTDLRVSRFRGCFEPNIAEASARPQGTCLARGCFRNR